MNSRKVETERNKEHRLAVWMEKQQKHYENNTGLLKKPEIRKKWEDFLIQYKEYLGDDYKLKSPQ